MLVNFFLKRLNLGVLVKLGFDLDNIGLNNVNNNIVRF